MSILLIDDININCLHVKFFRISSYNFYWTINLNFYNRKLNNAINIKKSYPNKVNRHRENNNKFLSNKKKFSYKHEEKSSQHFIKILKEIKCLFFFKEIQKIN